MKRGDIFQGHSGSFTSEFMVVYRGPGPKENGVAVLHDDPKAAMDAYCNNVEVTVTEVVVTEYKIPYGVVPLVKGIVTITTPPGERH